jgi:hypothetical protein
MKVYKYTSDRKRDWDTFLDGAKNTSFLFKRDFVEYHADRFQDYSLMIYNDSTLKAVIPANIFNGLFISHQGLSYGGVVIRDDAKLSDVILVVQSALSYLHEQGVVKCIIKSIPIMYHKRPANEVDWVMFKLNASLCRRDTALTIDNRRPKLQYQERRRRSIKKTYSQQVEIRSGYNELSLFWNEILTPNLLEKHGVAPVHSLEEINMLAEKFPENIKQHNIYLNDRIVAGCTMFLNCRVAHAQYISGSLLGRDSGCLDYLFDKLINEDYAEYDYFDFGICNEQNGQLINKGLLDWKEGFGARSIVHDFYEVNTGNYNLLENYTA